MLLQVVVALTVALGFLAGSACRSIRVDPEQRLEAYGDEPYASLLAASVRDGLVDYAVLRADHELDLDRYLDAVGRYGPRATPESFATTEQRLAYYLNAYNAIMLRRWLDSGAGEPGFDEGDEVNKLWFVWNRWRVDGSWVTLHALEQKLIRPVFDEARVHFALVCGALGCPPLLEEPFDAELLDEQLESLGRRWLAEPDGVRLDAEGRLWMSSIFEWYREDFEGLGGLAGVIQRFVEDEERRAALLAAAKGEILFLPYDWTINAAP